MLCGELSISVNHSGYMGLFRPAKYFPLGRACAMSASTRSLGIPLDSANTASIPAKARTGRRGHIKCFRQRDEIDT